MSEELKDILSNQDKNFEQEKLLQYLSSKLPDAEQHEFEKQMNDDEFMNDAVEGLQQLANKKMLPAYIQQLNGDLRKQLNKKKKRYNRDSAAGQYWTYIAIIVLLILVVVAYVVLKKI